MKAHFLNDDATQRPIEDWWYASSSLGLGPNIPVPRRPYIVHNELTDTVHQEVRETSNARDRPFQFYVYDHKGDFTRINNILNDLRDVVKGMAPFLAPDGTWCFDALWVGISGQVTDDGYDSGTKFATVRFTVSK
jgi:hypothetical protein